MLTHSRPLALLVLLTSCGLIDDVTGPGEDDTADTDTEGESCPDPQARQVCSPDDPTATYWEDSCGEIGDVAEQCPGIWLCIDGEGSADAECGCANIESEGRCYNEFPGLYGLNMIGSETVCGNVNTDPADAIEICDPGERCDTLFGGPPECVRSISEEQADSPYYDYSCGGFTEWLEYPTNLEADCRCRFIGDIGVDPQDEPGNGNVCDPINDINRTGKIMNCTEASTWAQQPWPLDYGSGQSFRAYRDNTATGGEFFGTAWIDESRELVAVMRWSRPEFGHTGAVVAFQVDTGARRIISGVYPDPELSTSPGAVPFEEFLEDLAAEEGPEAAYPDPTDPDIDSLNLPYGHFGSGYISRSRLTNQPYLQPLSGASIIRRGPDGMLYVGGAGTGQGSSKWYEIVRVDPDTGHRELVWKSQFYANSRYESGEIDDVYGQCFRHGFETYYRQSVQITHNSMVVASDGTFYIGFDDPRMGSGLLRIAADGSTCEFASRFGATERETDGVDLLPPDIGGGYTPDNADWYYGGLEYGGRLYFVRQFQNELVSFDPLTGDRVLEADDRDDGYNGIGYMAMYYDETRELMLTLGSTNPNAGSWLELGTGRRQAVLSDLAGDELVHSGYPTTAGRNGTAMAMAGHGNNFLRGGGIIDPENPDLLYALFEPAAFGVVELSTFNSMILSWDSEPATEIPSTGLPPRE